MWMRFSDNAEAVLQLARTEAEKIGSIYISTEHLLLGMVLLDNCCAIRILQRFGLSSWWILAEIERSRGCGKVLTGHSGKLSSAAIRVLDLANDEARRLSDDSIGTEHLLLGMLRDTNGHAGRLLTKQRISLYRARLQVRVMRRDDSVRREIAARLQQPGIEQD